jgi:hypothetical protein
MQANHGRTHLINPRERLVALIRLGLSGLAAIFLATACATHSGAIARPGAADAPAPRVVAGQAYESKRVEDGNSSRSASSEQEPLRELLDKYAPAAIEWSMLPRIAEHSNRLPQPRKVAAAHV